MVDGSFLWLSTLLALVCFTSVVMSHDNFYVLEELIDKRIVTVLEKVNAANQAQISALEERFANRERALLSKMEAIQQKYDYDISKLQEQIASVDDAADMNRNEAQRGADKMTSNDKIPTPKQGPSRRAQGQAQLAFFAVGPEFDFSDMAANQSITFATPTTNIGAAFQAGIGQFIAPLSGTYAFFVTVCGRLDGTNHFNVDHSGKITAKLFLGPTLEQSSQTVIIHMQAGERLSVKSGRSHDGVYGSYYTSISGFLLYEGSGPIAVGK